MDVISAVFRADQLREGMMVNIIIEKNRPMRRATITRVHLCQLKYFANDEDPPVGSYAFNSYRYRDGRDEHAFLISDDDRKVTDQCNYGFVCVHIRYRNNVSAIVGLWAIRPLEPLLLLAEQAVRNEG